MKRESHSYVSTLMGELPSAILLASLYWVLASILRVSLFHDGNLVQQLFAPAPRELWTRLLVVLLLVAYGVHGQIRQREQKRTAEALAKSEERLRILLDNLTIGVYRTTPDGQILFANPALVTLLGYSSFDELSSQNLESEGFHPAYPRSEFKQRMKWDGAVRGLESTWTKRDGSIVFLRENARAIRGEDGKTVYYEGTLEDITERKANEENLEFERRQLLSIFDGIGGSVIVTDPETHRILYANAYLEKIFNKTLAGEICHSALHDSDTPCEACGYAKALENKGRPYKWEFHEGVSHRDIAVTSHIVRWPDGRDVHLELAFDITDRKQMEQLLRESEAKFRTITSTAKDAVIMLDNDGSISYWNPAAEEILGYTSEEAVGKELRVLVAPERYHDAYQRGFSVFRGNGRGAAVGKTLQLEAIRKDGTEFPIEVSLSAIQVKDQWNAVAIVRDITERRRAEEALRASEQRFREFANLLPQIVFETDSEGRYTFINRQGIESSGHTPEDFADSLSPLEMVIPEDRERVRENIQRIFAGEKLSANEYTAVRKDGSTFPVIVYVNPIIRDGRPVGLRGIIIDITERKHAEEEQQASENRYRVLVEHLPQKIFVKDRDSVFVSCNKNYALDLKIRAADIAGKTDYEFFPRELAEKYRADDNRIMESGEAEEIEEKYIQDGKVLYVRTAKTPIRNEQGDVTGILGVFWDITERVQAEQALRESEAKFRTITSTAKDAVIMLDNDGSISYWNPAAEEIFGYTSEEAMGKQPHALMAPERYFEAYRRGFSVFRETGRGAGIGKTLQLEAIRKDGTEFPIEVSLSAIQVKGQWDAVAIVRDITERRRAEEALRESEAQYRSLIDNSHDAIYLLAGNKFELINPAFSEMLQVSLEEIWAPDFDFMQLVAPRSRPMMMEVLRMQEQGQVPPSPFEFTALRKDGTEIELEASVSRVMCGQHIVFQAILRDITERRKLEAQLLQVQKMEAVGQLAAGIAHEINSPIQYVGDNTRFLQDAFDDMSGLLTKYENLLDAVKAESQTDDVVREVEAAVEKADLAYLREEIPKAAEQALEGVRRVAEIVRAMKEFSHPSAKVKEPVDINRAVQTTITIARNEWKYVADMVTEFDPTLPMVPCLAGDINQVFLNVIINAAQAIAGVVGDGSNRKGTITISTCHAGDWVEIRIADTGTGIPENVRSKIFNPFFTTKEVGKGTGQGLAIAHSTVVKKHGGTITFETKEGKGTTFIIRLPVTSKKSLFERGTDEAANPLCG